MDVVGKSLHVGESAVGMEHALGVASALPCVVEIDVDVSGVAHTGADEHVGGGTDIGVGDVLGEVVPAVPTHRRRGGELLAEGRGGAKKGGTG